MSEVKTYQKKPIAVQAIQFNVNDANHWDEQAKSEWAALQKFTNFLVRYVDERADDADIYFYVFDKLHDTWVKFAPGDYIIKGSVGEFYPHERELFEKNYKQVGLRGLTRDDDPNRGDMVFT